MHTALAPQMPLLFLPMQKAIKTKKKESWNLQGRYQFQGLPISVENKAGSYRRGQDKDGHKWKTFMHYDYGYVRNTLAKDGDAVDVYVNKKSKGKRIPFHSNSGKPYEMTDVYVIHQKKIEYSGKWPNGICPDCKKHHTECTCTKYYDEDKVMLGFDSKDDAVAAYLRQYDSKRFLGPVSTYTIDEFKAALKRSFGKKLPSKKPKHEHWEGFDLDGTLAKDDGWKGKEHIGEPIEKTRKLIEKKLEQGKKVKIFTARASDPKTIPYIKDWLKQNNIPLLEITNKKDPGIVNIYDDRAVQVRKNTGNLVKGFSDGNDIRILCSEDAAISLVKLLSTIQTMGNQGASRSIMIEDYGRHDFDGDGSAKIDSITINGQPLKKFKKKNGEFEYPLLKKFIKSYGNEMENISLDGLTRSDMLRIVRETKVPSPEEMVKFLKSCGKLHDEMRLSKAVVVKIPKQDTSGINMNLLESSFGVKFEMEPNERPSKMVVVSKSYLGQPGDQGGSHAILRENLGPKIIHHTLGDILDEIDKSYAYKARIGEDMQAYTARFMREHSSNQVQAMLDRPQNGELVKAFVRAHKRKGKTVGPYFNKRTKKVTHVKHTKLLGLDLSGKEAKEKISAINKKKEHHDLHIDAASDMKVKVEAHKQAGNTSYTVGKNEHHVDKVLKDLDDHIDHHTNENRSHDNHIKKIEKRHETVAKQWEEKKKVKKEAKGHDRAKAIIKETLGTDKVSVGDILKVMTAAKNKGEDDYAHMNNYLMSAKPELKDEINAAGIKLDASQKKQAIGELIKDGEHEGQKIDDDVLAVLKKMKGEEKPSKKVVAVKKEKTEAEKKQARSQAMIGNKNAQKFGSHEEYSDWLRKQDEYVKETHKLDRIDGELTATWYPEKREIEKREEKKVVVKKEELDVPRKYTDDSGRNIIGVSKVKDSIVEGLLILKGGKKMLPEKAEAIKRSIRNAMVKVDNLLAEQKTEPVKEKSLPDLFDDYYSAKTKEERIVAGKLAQAKYMSENPGASLQDYIAVANKAKPTEEDRKPKAVVVKKKDIVTKKEEPKIEERQPKAVTVSREKILDFGEKIGGARKDLALRGFTTGRGKTETDDIPAWKKRYEVNEIVGGSGTGKFVISDTKSKFGRRLTNKLFDSREEAEGALALAVVVSNHRVQPSRRESADSPQSFEIVRLIGKNKQPVIKDGFKSREDALKHLALNAEEIITTKLRLDDTIHPILEQPVRKGKDYRNGKDVNSEDFKKFGFRGVEFGNWNNTAERQLILNNAYDSFMDMSEVMGISPKDISLDGELAIGFGSRGQGLSGAKAHFERSYGAINLTKMKGMGSLAHEWWHAMDHYLARKAGKSSSEKITNNRGDTVFKTGSPLTDFASHGFDYRHNISKELKDSLDSIDDNIHHRKMEYKEDSSVKEKIQERGAQRVAEEIDKFRKNLTKDYSGEQYAPYRGKRNKPATKEQMERVDYLVDRIKHGDIGPNITKPGKTAWSGVVLPDRIAELADIFKEVRGRNAYRNVQGRLTGDIANLRYLANWRKNADEDLAEAKEQKVKTKKVASDFKSAAWKMDQSRSSDYWQSDHEISARAFESWLYDKIKDDGNRNDFLTYEKHNNHDVYKLFGIKPYPEGEERKNINKEFDKFFGIFKKDDHFKSKPKTKREFKYKAG